MAIRVAAAPLPARKPSWHSPTGRGRFGNLTFKAKPDGSICVRGFRYARDAGQVERLPLALAY
ncbi:hypothetical protein SC1_04257 [Sphingopyxis sp. C-1]|nr:hypothetical protein SC1_04257 [Sphingopyxis sp. C-1]